MNSHTSSLVNVLRYIERPLMDDGRIDLGETALCLRMIRPFVQAGDPGAIELNQLLSEVRADGVITPEESEKLIRMLAKLANENQTLAKYVHASVVDGVKKVDTSGIFETVGAFKAALETIGEDLENLDYGIVCAPRESGRILGSAMAAKFEKALVASDDTALKGDKVVVVDDVLTDGVELSASIDKIEKAGGKIVKVVVIAELDGYGARVNALKSRSVLSLVKIAGK